MNTQPQHSKQPNHPMAFLAPYGLERRFAEARRATAPFVLTSEDADVSPLGVLDERGG